MMHHNPTYAELHRPEEGARVFEAPQARQGEAILKRPWQHAVFIAGLVGSVILGLVALGAMLSG
jgi:hypothetical protein